MPKNPPYKNRIELLQGTLDMLILRNLRKGSAHGYGIAQAIRSRSGDVLQVETGSLYPALHRLEKQGWIKSEWRATEHNQRAKYYSLTASGNKQLAAEQSRWNELSAAIARLMNSAESKG
jgi:transcriptional regulator